MAKSSIAFLLLVLALLAAACGGGGDGVVDGLVTIDRLDLEDADLDPLYFSNPPPENSYPDVVAAVNGVEITGDSLASREVMLELGGRQLRGLDALPEAVLAQEMIDPESDDPLEDLIDDELERQAVIRLGLLPSYAEGLKSAQAHEDYLRGALEALAPEDREKLERVMRVAGQYEEGWSSDPAWVERFRASRGLFALKQQYCHYEAKTSEENRLTITGGYDCTAFLRQERQRAEIVYYVRWAD
jgi:hypothetical protein